MDNHGKIWSIDNDQQLMENPQYPDSYFCSSMGRSDNAIKCRRNHLAIKMYQNDPSSPLEVYVRHMKADYPQAALMLKESTEKRATFKSMLDTNKKRKAIPDVQSRFFAEGESKAPELPSYWHDKTPDERVSSICQSIREEEGNLSSVFNDPGFLPVLIQHYPGFEAYARLVQARTTLKNESY